MPDEPHEGNLNRRKYRVQYDTSSDEESDISSRHYYSRNLSVKNNEKGDAGNSACGFREVDLLDTIETDEMLSIMEAANMDDAAKMDDPAKYQSLSDDEIIQNSVKPSDEVEEVEVMPKESSIRTPIVRRGRRTKSLCTFEVKIIYRRAIE